MTGIYLVSPPEFKTSEFLPILRLALETRHVSRFQLRTKIRSLAVESAPEIKKLCSDLGCEFIVNDFVDLALDIGADGVHIGGDDESILSVKTRLASAGYGKFLVGVSCYDSKSIAETAARGGASYLSFGTFFPSVTKNSSGKPVPEILSWCRKSLCIPSVAIGGIDDKNCAELVRAGANFIAVISYVWQNINGVQNAINRLHFVIENEIAN